MKKLFLETEIYNFSLDFMMKPIPVLTFVLSVSYMYVLNIQV